MAKAADWLREERRKVLGDWVAFCLGCGAARRWFEDFESELPDTCPQCGADLCGVSPRAARRSRRWRSSTARSAASPCGRTSSSARGSAVAEWFVQNVADAEWWVNEKFGARTMLVPHGSQVGARVHVLEPDKPM